MHYSKLVFLLILAFSLASPSFAGTVEWSSAAMACTPTSSTVAEGRYVTTAGRVKFKKGKFGLISFICPVTRKLKKGSYILKSHTTLTGSRGQTSITLRKSKKDSNSISNILTANISLAKTANKHQSQKSGPKKLIFDTNKFYYWVQLTIKKSNARGERAIHGVELIRQ